MSSGASLSGERRRTPGRYRDVVRAWRPMGFVPRELSGRADGSRQSAEAHAALFAGRDAC
jgi:hypothetical protein